MGIKQVKIGLLGFGTVGVGVWKYLTERAELFEERTGTHFEIKKILVKDLKKSRKFKVDPKLLTTDPQEILRDPEISIVVEVMGGIEPAFSYLMQALNSGKKAVTANKLLLAHHGAEIFSCAREKRVPLGFEASVAGGIPIIKAIQDGFVGNEIVEIYGIVNATSNFILSEMTGNGCPFDQALVKAGQEGLVESDPQMDIDGGDAAQKLSILVSLCSGSMPQLEKIYVEGIGRITPFDIESARSLGFRVKLLAICKQKEGKIEARVHPTLIPISHPLAGVNGVFNAVCLKGDGVGETMFYGRGGGMMPTASAVVADIVGVEKSLLDPTHLPRATRTAAFLPMEEIVTEYYLRFTVIDRPGVLARIANALGSHDISIRSVHQYGQDQGGKVPIIVMLHQAKERNVQLAIREIDQMEPVLDKTMLIRVEHL